MKRLSATPTEPRQEVSPAVEQSTLPPVSPPVIQRMNSVPLESPHQLPPGQIYGHNLKKLSSYNKLRRNKKLSIQKQVFLDDVGAILSQFPVEDYLYDDELLITFLNICESYFVCSSAVERKESKDEALRLMLPYFRDDVQLLKKSVAHVWHKVKKSSALKRMVARLVIFFKKNLLA